MLGADIVTAEFDSASPPSCAVVDRHVKSVGYPLDASEGGDAVFPDEDTCGKSSWTLVDCTVDTANGTMTLEVDRPLKAGNAAEDRDIDTDSNIILAAWGDGFAYHKANRHSSKVDFKKNGAVAVGGQSLKDAGLIPKDATGSQLLQMSGYAVPGNETHYACAGFLIDVPEGGGPRQIVAAEPIIDLSTDAGKMLHHFVLYSCQKVCASPRSQARADKGCDVLRLSDKTAGRLSRVSLSG
jgi:hypothetical protein